VYHERFAEWGSGVVVEVWNSRVPDGNCFVKVRFQDGRIRIFNNDVTSKACCYYAGVIRLRKR
jgi:hypothetical protein